MGRRHRALAELHSKTVKGMLHGMLGMLFLAQAAHQYSLALALVRKYADQEHVCSSDNSEALKLIVAGPWTPSG